ncbi:LysE family translocator [Hymenobacter crusticola]|uniref:LysE family translocator n=1 Tax=Hymenobacter crusticola TaxID=1770526 RepID=UPI001FE5B87A|nr:LysE family translocator [Hymenobacter crusticola]
MTALLFTMTPGLDTIFILNKSIGQGHKAGLYSTLGINTGVLVHTLFAALGLSLIVAQSAIAFAILKYLGAAYLLYLGVQKLRSKQALVAIDAADQPPTSDRQNFVSGVVTNVLNPKVALFFLAFFPQFIEPTALNNPLPFLLLGLTYAAIGVLWFTLLTMFAAYFAARVMQRPAASTWLNRISGGAFILMGLKVALTRR